MGSQKFGYRRVLTRTVAAVALSTLAACDSPTTVQPPALQTHAALYRFSASYESIRVNIPYVFTNLTGSAVYLVNCDGRFAWRLERKVGDEWQTAWQPVQRACLSPPIVIAPGRSLSGTLIVELGTIPWSNAPPTFDVSQPFRLLWTGVLSSIDGSQYPAGPEIPETYRASNTFRLTMP